MEIEPRLLVWEHVRSKMLGSFLEAEVSGGKILPTENVVDPSSLIHFGSKIHCHVVNSDYTTGEKIFEFCMSALEKARGGGIPYIHTDPPLERRFGYKIELYNVVTFYRAKDGIT